MTAAHWIIHWSFKGVTIIIRSINKRIRISEILVNQVKFRMLIMNNKVWRIDLARKVYFKEIN